jgi:ubiquinone biosynthesis protein
MRELPASERHGLRYAAERVVAWMSRPFLDPDLVDEPFAVQLRRRLEMLGATYVKLGQLLALRKDLLPEEVTRELEQLLDRLPALPYPRFLELVRKELGRDPFEVFTYIETRPIGSASIGQAHRAGLRDGRAVILKLVKPGIREQMEQDLALLNGVGWLLDRFLSRFEPRRAIEEFSYYLLRELDLELEGDHADIFASNFKDDPDVVFPKVIREYSTRNLICLEFLRGISPSSPEAQELPLEDRQKLIDIGARAILRMLYRDGFFHADLHPGNLLILPGPKVGFLDLGQVGRFDETLRRNLLLYYFCLVRGDAEHAARYLSSIARPGPGADPRGFERDVADIARRFYRHSAEEYSSLGRLVLASVGRGVRYRMYFPVELVLMVKAIVTFESVGRLLDPHLDVSAVSSRHLTALLVHQFHPLRLARESLYGAPEVIDTLVKLPLLVATGLKALEQATSRPPENPFSGIRGTLLAGFSLLSGSLVLAVNGPAWLWGSLFLLAVFLALRPGR